MLDDRPRVGRHAGLLDRVTFDEGDVARALRPSDVVLLIGVVEYYRDFAPLVRGRPRPRAARWSSRTPTAWPTACCCARLLFALQRRSVYFHPHADVVAAGQAGLPPPPSSSIREQAFTVCWSSSAPPWLSAARRPLRRPGRVVPLPLGDGGRALALAGHGRRSSASTTAATGRPGELVAPTRRILDLFDRHACAARSSSWARWPRTTPTWCARSRPAATRSAATASTTWTSTSWARRASRASWPGPGPRWTGLLGRARSRGTARPT